MDQTLSNDAYLQLIAAKDAAWDAYYESGSDGDLKTAVEMDRELEQQRALRVGKGS